MQNLRVDLFRSAKMFVFQSDGSPFVIYRRTISEKCLVVQNESVATAEVIKLVCMLEILGCVNEKCDQLMAQLKGHDINALLKILDQLSNEGVLTSNNKKNKTYFFSILQVCADGLSCKLLCKYPIDWVMVKRVIFYICSSSEFNIKLCGQIRKIDAEGTFMPEFTACKQHDIRFKKSAAIWGKIKEQGGKQIMLILALFWRV